MVWILFLLAAGILITRDLRRQSRIKIGWYFLIIGTAVLFLLSINPVSDFLVYYLESQYKPPSVEVLSRADIIVILNGGVSPSGGFRKNPEPSGATYSRVFNGVETFKQSKAKALVMSGANGINGSEGDIEVMKNLAVALGIQADKIIVESMSRHTLEHAIELAKIFPPENGMRIGIVTSALHIPRAVQAFRKKYPKDSIIPVPVGYTYYPHRYGIDSLIPSTYVLSQSSYAIHELIGMVLYSLWYN
ncbi:MAG: YdcF family protein [Nitrospinae bacterium]|nr:YdcF family protein [Nitrospinota bacterium]